MTTWTKKPRANVTEAGMPVGLLLSLTHATGDVGGNWEAVNRSGTTLPGMPIGFLLTLTHADKRNNHQDIWTKINFS